MEDHIIEYLDYLKQNNHFNKLKKQYEKSYTNLNFITLAKDTVLYHKSINNDSYNPFSIKINNNHLVAYFGTNKIMAADYSLVSENYPVNDNYLHKFKTNNDLNLISIDLDQNISFMHNIENLFMQKSIYDGIIFIKSNNETYHNEIALIEPNKVLIYVSTQKCVNK